MIGQQIVTILAVVVGAVMSFLGTFALEERRRKADKSRQWSELQLQVYSTHLMNAQRVVAITRTLVLDLLTEEDSRRVRAELESAHMERNMSVEHVRLLAPPVIVEAAYLLNRSVWQLQDFARGELEWDEQVWRRRYEHFTANLFGFEKAIRAELGVPGDIPYPPRPPEWFLRKRT
ncbi:hypothetical protein GCM10010372_36820 [Streptomyces tauricus]|uniref:hypothetical protein n=1 Tax=Streptomyces tauricus TaxID=68274 RepID=UPI001678051F|nr:hypothetical protein [Streptomyces tauricus]GHA33387.1 hypothetical protein GCM10010372_36820 [Streptomyces tauricus]